MDNTDNNPTNRSVRPTKLKILPVCIVSPSLWKITLMSAGVMKSAVALDKSEGIVKGRVARAIYSAL